MPSGCAYEKSGGPCRKSDHLPASTPRRAPPTGEHPNPWRYTTSLPRPLAINPAVAGWDAAPAAFERENLRAVEGAPDRARRHLPWVPIEATEARNVPGADISDCSIRFESRIAAT